MIYHGIPEAGIKYFGGQTVGHLLDEGDPLIEYRHIK